MLRMTGDASLQSFPGAFPGPYIGRVVHRSRSEAEVGPGSGDHCGSRRPIEEPNGNPPCKTHAANQYL